MSENNKARLNKGLVLSMLMQRDDLRDTELRVALKILSRRDDSNAWCQISQSTLADYMRMPQQKINRIIERLRKKKILESTFTYDHTTMRRGSNQYFFVADWHLLNALVRENSMSEELIEDMRCVKLKLNGKADPRRLDRPK